MAATKIAASTGTSSGKKRPQRGFGQCLSHRVHHTRTSFSASATAPAISAHLQRDVIEPVLWKRRVGLRHRAISHVVRLSVGILAILDHDAHRRQFVADAIGFLEVLSGAGGGPLRNQTDRPAAHRRRSPAACGPSMPPRSRQEAEQPQRGGKLAAIAFAAGRRRFRRPCSAAIICGVFRSSESASITAGRPVALGVGGDLVPVVERFRAFLQAFEVQSIGER